MLAEVKASAADTGGRYSLVEITAPAGHQVPLHVHYRDDEGFYVLEGSVTIHVGDETVELSAGQHAYGPRDVPHTFTIGPDGAKMLWVLVPSGFEDFIEAASVPAETATVPPASVVPPSRSAIARMLTTSRRAVQCRAASRLSAFAAKCQVVEDSATPASAATRRCVTAATPSRATMRTVAATIASRVRREASARGPVSVDTVRTLQERSYL
jgi:quercetin dioxygenase-like cupin family protein